MNLSGIELTNFYWKDRFKFKSVAQSKRRGLTGVMDIQHQVLKYGQPIELTGGWLWGAEINQLIGLESAPDVKRIFTDSDGTEYTVLFDIGAGGVSPQPVGTESEPDDSTRYSASIYLITVEPDTVPDSQG